MEREDPLADTLVENPRGLLARYGRDPRRASWAIDAEAGGERRSERPRSHANGNRQRGTARPIAAAGGTERHQIVCSGCGQESQVPFQPDPTRPVYCSDCFRSRGRGGRRSADLARA